MASILRLTTPGRVEFRTEKVTTAVDALAELDLTDEQRAAVLVHVAQALTPSVLPQLAQALTPPPDHTTGKADRAKEVMAMETLKEVIP